MPTIETPKKVAKKSGVAAQPAAPKLTAAQKKKIEEADALIAASAPRVDGKTLRDVVTKMCQDAVAAGGNGLHLLAGTDAEGHLLFEEFPPGLDLRITGAMARKILGWETEEDYIKRRMLLNPSLDKSQCTFERSVRMMPTFKFGCNPKTAALVVCWNNDRNRDLDLRRCQEFAQTILTKQWAGFNTMESINGESGVIGNTGQPLSIQHCLVGLLMAIDIWNEQEKWREFWPEEPFIEKLVVVGVSEAARVVQSLDNIRPRSVDDELYAGDEFRDLEPPQRREVTRYAAKAIDFLWKRTEAEKTTRLGTKRSSSSPDGMTAFLTHATSREFLARHDRLKKCVRLIFDLNKSDRGRPISTLNLSAGQSAAMFYLMACSTSDIDRYRKPKQGLPSENQLEFPKERWDEAWKFWSKLADKDATEFEPLRRVLRGFHVAEDEADGIDDDGIPLLRTESVGGGNLLEKSCVLAMAWQQIVNGQWPTVESLQLTIHDYEDGRRGLVNRNTFGGIDCCHVPALDLTEPKTPAEREAETKKIDAEKIEVARKKQQADAQAKVDAERAKAPRAAKLDELAAQAEKNSAAKNGGIKPLTSKQVQAAQTAKARADDEAMAAEQVAEDVQDDEPEEVE